MRYITQRKGEKVGHGVKVEAQRKVSCKAISTSILVVSMILSVAAVSEGALPAPTWMPGSPILAGNQVILLWTPVAGAVKYFIYFGGKKVQETQSIQSVIASPEGAGNFEYQVSAVDAAGAEGPKSVPGIVKIFKLVAPRDLNARMIGGKVGMNWSPVPGAILYNVYRSEESGKGFVLKESVQDMRWTDSTAEKNKKYYYKVSAKDASGKESELSAEVQVSTEEVVEAQGQAQEKKLTRVIGRRTKALAGVSDKEFTGTGFVQLQEPVDIERSPGGDRIYVSSANTRSVLMFNAELEFLGNFENPPDATPLGVPYGIGVAPDGGDVYVVDFTNSDIKVFTADGKFKKVFAKVVQAPWMKEGISLHDVVVDRSGKVYLLEGIGVAVITFDADGKELSHFAKRYEGEDMGYANKMKLADGKLYLQDFSRARLLVTDLKGKTLGKVGEKGVGVGKMVSLGGFDIDQKNKRAYMADKNTNLVQVYELGTGKYLYTLANKENTGPMDIMAPKALMVVPDKERIYVNMGLANRVGMFEMFGEAEAR